MSQAHSQDFSYNAGDRRSVNRGVKHFICIRV